jgi:hypothetical protein
LVAQTEGQKQSASRFNARNEGVLYIKDVDADNSGLFVKIRENGVLVEHRVDTSVPV